MGAPEYLPKALAHLRRRDGRLAPLIAEHGPPTLSRTRNAFESLGRSILYQQLNGKAARSIYLRFLALFGSGRFPTPDALIRLSVDRLRTAGVSRQKATYLLALAASFVDGEIRPRRFARMTDQEIVDALTQVRGIGPWSAHMFLMFGLNRPDVLPVGDYGVQMGMRKYFGLGAPPKAAHMHELAAVWQPYRTIASWYMWRVHEAS